MVANNSVNLDQENDKQRSLVLTGEINNDIKNIFLDLVNGDKPNQAKGDKRMRHLGWVGYSYENDGIRLLEDVGKLSALLDQYITLMDNRKISNDISVDMDDTEKRTLGEFIGPDYRDINNLCGIDGCYTKKGNKIITHEIIL